MKKVILFMFLVVCISADMQAQNVSLTPQVRPTQGAYYRVNNTALSWTLGQPFQASLKSGNVSLSQGFQQIDIPKKPAIVKPKSICSDSAAVVTLYNVTAGTGGNHVEWALNRAFTGSHIINSGDSITLTLNSGVLDTLWMRSRVGTNGCISSTINTTVAVLPLINTLNKIGVANELCAMVDTIHLATLASTEDSLTYQWQYSINGTAYDNISSATNKNYDLTNPQQQSGWFRRVVYQVSRCQKVSNTIKIQ